LFTVVEHKFGYFSTMTANNAVHSSTPSLLKNLVRTDHGTSQKNVDDY
jgi:hypothetical protein